MRIVSWFSWTVNVPQDGVSLGQRDFSGSQKVPVNRSHTSASLSSRTRFQLMVKTRSISFMPSLTESVTESHLTREFQVSLATDRPIADKTGSELVF